MRNVLTAWCAALCASAAIAQPTIVYEAASGSGPGSQCWTYNGTNAPVPSDGVLDFGSSSTGEVRTFSRADLTDFRFTGRFEINARVRVVSGAYNANPCGAGQRTAVGFSAGDSDGRLIIVGLGTNRVFLSTQNNAPSNANNPSVAYEWGGAMRDVRLVINNLYYELYIDAVRVIALSRPAAPTGEGTPERCSFGGDLTVCMPGHGQFESFSVTAYPNGQSGISIHSQPAASVLACAASPVTLSVTATSPWTIGYLWRRNGEALANGALGDAIVSGADNSTLSIAGYTSAQDGQYDCVLANSCGSRVTVPASVSLPTPCGPADVGRQGGVACPDGQLDNNDFIVFIDFFFAGNPAADRGVQGGIPGADSTFDNNDFIVFIDQFFSGC